MSIKKTKISLVYASKYDVSFKKDRPLHLMIIIYIVIFVILSLEPVDLFEWWGENLASMLAVALLARLYKKYKLTNSSYACILILLILHSIGAHYTYSFCPIGDWLKGYLGLKRNNFDRLVSFTFGLLISFPVMELLYRKLRIRYIQACVLSSVIVLSICALYELYEMYFSMILSPEQSVIFLGGQGDIWDSQNDMVMVLLGTLITMGGYIFLRLKKNHMIHIIKS
jgi:putative membrane protein